MPSVKFQKPGGGTWHTSIINGTAGVSTIDYSGFSILYAQTLKNHSSFLFSMPNIDVRVCSLIFGNFYSMPNAANLSLTMNIEYGKTKELTSINGSSYSNTMWNKPPNWGNLGAWELYSGWSAPEYYFSDQRLSRSGRRTWNLTFSYLDDSDLFGPNQSLNYLRTDTNDGTDSGDIAADGTFNSNIIIDDNFFSQVWHRTNGGTIPFIFQPDSDGQFLEYNVWPGNNNPDQFAICRIAENSLKATQVAPNLYDISLKIEEVW